MVRSFQTSSFVCSSESIGLKATANPHVRIFAPFGGRKVRKGGEERKTTPFPAPISKNLDRQAYRPIGTTARNAPPPFRTDSAKLCSANLGVLALGLAREHLSRAAARGVYGRYPCRRRKCCGQKAWEYFFFPLGSLETN